MDESEKRKTKRWLATWARASAKLDALKKRKLRHMDDTDAIEAISVHQPAKTDPSQDIMQRESVILAGWYTKIHLLQLQKKLDELGG